MTSAADITYRYLARSTVESHADGIQLALATSGGSEPSGDVDHPYFFDGFIEKPAVIAQALLVLARVARTRFYVPPNTLAAILRAADPVITATPDGLRLEAFSVCCGVYARLDIDADALDISHIATGVTNVDVNPPLRQALAGLRPSEPLRLKVGDDQLRVATLDREVIEESVPLSTRWLKGFAETQALFAGMSLRHELTGIAVSQFIQGLPRSSSTRSSTWATSTGRTLRLASRPSAGAVCIAGPERLRVLEPLARFATALRGYSATSDAGSLPMASAWMLELPHARMTIGLSPEKSRGFSGEGSLLATLAAGVETRSIRAVSDTLSYQSRIDPRRISARIGREQAEIDSILGALASFGQLGFDFATDAYFHRPLPFRGDEFDGRLGELHPRLADAHKLIGAGLVERDGDAGEFRVRSADAEYRVILGLDVADDRCTCQWYIKYRGTRGPCKHVLAARALSSGDPRRGAGA